MAHTADPVQSHSSDPGVSSDPDANQVKVRRRPSTSQNSIMASFIERNQSSFDLSSLSLDGPSNSEQMKMQMEMESVLLEAYGQGIEKGFVLADVIPVLSEGISVVVDDGFHRCFQENPVRPWNWTPTLYFFWCIGVVIRFGILFPLRFLSLIAGLLLTALGFLIGAIFFAPAKRNDWNCKCITFLANVVVLSWTGLIRFHGKLPERKLNQIYAANHTSMIDVIVLLQKAPFSIVGQHHTGWVAFFQDHVLACLQPIWFRRDEIKDRSATASRIKDHIKQPDGNRLLIFPEGTCVNNEYCVQFKKGIFEMNAEICPIAIKYNKQFVDAFWNSRARPFHLHLFDLMTGWAVVADVWFLPPVSRNPEETPIDFAARVKKMICDQAGLINVDWDGYMKYLLPSSRFLQKRQKLFADSVLSKIDHHGEPESSKDALIQSELRFRG